MVFLHRLAVVSISLLLYHSVALANCNSFCCGKVTFFTIKNQSFGGCTLTWGDADVSSGTINVPDLPQGGVSEGQASGEFFPVNVDVQSTDRKAEGSIPITLTCGSNVTTGQIDYSFTENSTLNIQECIVSPTLNKVTNIEGVAQFSSTSETTEVEFTITNPR